VPLFGVISHAAPPILTGGGLTLLEEGPVVATNGDPAPVNLATGETPFGSSELGGAKHLIIRANDGKYGNAFSWIDGADPPVADVPFIGIDLGASAVVVNRIAFGRSNVLAGDVCGGGVCMDRHLGLYTLQYTRVPNPDATLVTTGNNATGWVEIGTLEYIAAGGTNFDFPHRRHLYGFDTVTATGLRLITVDGTAIDELELYHVPEPVPTLTEWGIFFLILLLAGAAFFHVRKLQPRPDAFG
jgi:hypothetical protein